MINYHSQRQFIDGRVLDYEFKCLMQGRWRRRARAWSSEIRSEHGKQHINLETGWSCKMAETHVRCLNYCSQSSHTIRSTTSPNNGDSSTWACGMLSLFKPPQSRQGMVGLGGGQKTLQKKKNELGPEMRGVEGFFTAADDIHQTLTVSLLLLKAMADGLKRKGYRGENPTKI